MSNITIRYNVTGSERKRLAECIAKFLGCEKQYLGMPSCAYRVGNIEVSVDGAVTFDNSVEIGVLIEELRTEGFNPEENAATVAEANAKPAAREDAATDTANEDDDTEQGTDVGLTVRVPLDFVAVDNLKRILDAKGGLIRKALGVKDLPVNVEEDTVAFPWFEELPDADEVTAYTHLIAALCGMSKSLKRVTATERSVDNEKYAFRCFLLRLGFIGNQYKHERKILLGNLTGSSAFKRGTGGADDAVS